MATLLFTIGGAVVNALAFIGTNFVFSRLTDHGEEERKRHDLALEKLQRARDKWNEDRMKRLDFINERSLEQNKARAYTYNNDEAMVEYYRIFAKQIKPYHLSLNNRIFTSLQRHTKMVHCYLSPWDQALQHMLYTNTLNKWQKKRKCIKHTISPIIFGQVERQ